MLALIKWSDIVEVLVIAVRYIGAFFCNIIYSLISWIYQVFMTVARVNILSSDQISPIYQRVTMILTIVMVFYITFEFVKYVVQPDAITDKEKGVSHMAIRLVIVIVLIAFVPKIFTMAYEVQNKILANQVLSKIILGKTNQNYGKLGSEFSADMLGLFYRTDEEFCSALGSLAAVSIACKEGPDNVVTANLNELRNTGTANIYPGINLVTVVDDNGTMTVMPHIKFDGLLAIVVGCFILYILVMYCIDVGVRYAQLLFLQIISPVAIMGYLSPKKDNMFQKWLKQCTTTYLDLFIRLAIIYFILLIVRVLGTAFSEGTLFQGIEGLSWDVKALAFIAIVMGLLVFALKAPKMLQELFPSSGAASMGFGLGPKNRFEPTKNGISRTWNAGKRTVGGVAGTIGGAYKGFKEGRNAWSAAKAAYRGLRAGAGKGGGIRKGLDAARSSVQKDLDIKEAGGDPWTADIHGGREADRAKAYDRETARYEAVQKAKGTVGNSVKELKARQFVDELKNTDAAKGNAELLDRLGGDVKAVEKASRVYAVARDSGDQQKVAAAYTTLETTIKSSMVGTGYYQGDKNNSLVLSTMKGADGKLIDTKTEIRQGTLDASKIDKLETTATLTDSLKAIMKKSRADRTTAEQQQIEAFLTVHEQHTEEINKFVAGKIEAASDKWGTVSANIKDAMAVASDIGSDTIKVDNVDRTISSLDAETFAKELGTIDDMAGRVIRERQTSRESKEMHANAQGAPSDKK